MTPKAIAMVALLVLFGALPATPAFARTQYLPRDSEIRDLERLYSRRQLSLPTASFPVSKHELVEFAERLLQLSLSGEERAAVEAYIESLEYEDERFRYDYELGLSYQHFLPGGIDTDDFYYLLRTVEPSSSVRLYYGRDDLMVFYLQADFVKDFSQFDRTENYTNFPPFLDGDPYAVEYNNVTRGYWQQFLGPLELVFGRQPAHLGPAPQHALHVSQDVPFLDALRINLPVGRVRMTLITSTLENRRAAGERDPANVNIPSSDDPDVLSYGYEASIILYNVHRFELDLDRLRIGLGAHMLLSRANNMFRLSDFFPVFSWHNANVVPNNLSLVGDFSFALAPGIQTYVQYGFDDINLNPIGISDDDIPTLVSLLGGVTFFHGTRAAQRRSQVELGYTHWLWGSFEDDNYLSRAIYRLDLVGENRWIPLTSPFGPGTAWMKLRTETEYNSGWEYYGRALFRLENTEADLAMNDYQNDTSVREAEWEPRSDIGLGVAYTALGRLRLSVEPSVALKRDSPRVEVILGARTALGIGGFVN